MSYEIDDKDVDRAQALATIVEEHGENQTINYLKARFVDSICDLEIILGPMHAGSWGCHVLEYLVDNSDSGESLHNAFTTFKEIETL